MDDNGNLFTYDIATSTVTEVAAGGTVTHLSVSLVGTPTQIALDPSGNVYAAGGGGASITEFALGSTGSYTAGSVSFTPTALQLRRRRSPSMRTATYSSTTAPARRFIARARTAGILTSTIASGFDNVVSLALDNRGNLYVSDTGTKAIY